MFDAQGHLIGITACMLRDSHNLTRSISRSFSQRKNVRIGENLLAVSDSISRSQERLPLLWQTSVLWHFRSLRHLQSQGLLCLRLVLACSSPQQRDVCSHVDPVRWLYHVSTASGIVVCRTGASRAMSKAVVARGSAGQKRGHWPMGTVEVSTAV